MSAAAASSSSSASPICVGFWRQFKTREARDRAVQRQAKEVGSPIQWGVWKFRRPGTTDEEFAAEEAADKAKQERKRQAAEDAEWALPWPTPTVDAKAWRAQAEFRIQLRKVEQACQGFDKKEFFGASVCRLCRKMNGSEEYAMGGYVWPSGYLHYLQNHLVLAPQPFVDMVLGFNFDAYASRKKQEVEDIEKKFNGRMPFGMQLLLEHANRTR